MIHYPQLRGQVIRDVVVSESTVLILMTDPGSPEDDSYDSSRHEIRFRAYGGEMNEVNGL